MKLGLILAAFSLTFFGCMDARECADMCKPRGVLVFIDGDHTCVCNPQEASK